MQRSILTAAVVLLGSVGLLAAGSAAAEANEGAAAAKKLNVAVVTGGHPFNEAEFFKLFQDYDDIAYQHLPQKSGGELFDDIAHWPYDVIVLYNFNQSITPKQQENFVKLLQKGVGLVILHHANAAYNNWPLFWQIAGVEYRFRPWQQDGVPMAPSGYKGGVHFRVHVADPHHPITQGLEDYDFLDETYCRTSVDPGVHALLTTDEPSSDKTLSWVKTFARSRVFYLQSGHDQTAYQNPNYRKLVVRAIRWTAGKSP
jgi:type 1 glutamine amidotransferase